MKQFSEVIKEIRGILSSIILFYIMLNTVLVFLIVYLVLSILDLYPITAIIPAMIYLIFLYYRETKLNKILIVERYYPELNEKLRTAADYVKVENNAVVNELHMEVMEEVKRVTASSFFNRKETITKIASIVIMCFLIVFITFLNLNLGDYKVRLFDKINDVIHGEGGAGDSIGFGESLAGSGGNSEIYGKRSIALLGDEKLEVQMKPSSYEFVIRQSDEEYQEEEFVSQIPTDITATESKNFIENLPVERDKQQLIKTYFRKLAEG